MYCIHSQTILLVIENDHIMPYIFRIEMSVFGQKLLQQKEASLRRGSGRLAIALTALGKYLQDSSE